MSAPLPLRMIAAEIEDIAGRLADMASWPVVDAKLADHLRTLADQVRTHAGYEPTEHDHRMIHHAKARGKVRLRNGDLVTLTAWKVKGARDRARVVRSEASGPFSVPVDEIAEVINPTPTPKEIEQWTAKSETNAANSCTPPAPTTALRAPKRPDTGPDARPTTTTQRTPPPPGPAAPLSTAPR